MALPDAGEMFVFEGFRLDRRGLSRRDEDGAFVPVAIGSRALDVLGVLVGQAGDLVARDEIVARVWPTTVVEDNNLNIQIGALRRALDRGRPGGSCIQTISGRGYRFAAPVTRVPEAAHANAAAPAPASPPLQPGAAPRLSIVVLPFNNLGNDPEQQYFADGITEDLTTDLSRLAGMFVISCNTAFTYRGKRVDTKRIGRELCVRYVLEGSVRRSGDRIRVNAQLIDAETVRHLWAERFDSDTSDIFALQNEITGRLANALGAELIAAEAARPTGSPDALDYILRGRATALKPTSRDSYTEMIGLFEQALALDPQSVEAQTRLASALANRALIGVSDTAAADIARAEELVDRALVTSPRSAAAHFAKANVLRAQGRSREAIPEYEAVLAIDRNAVGVLDALADCKLMAGAVEDVIALEEQAIRLSPRDPDIGWWYLRIGQVHLFQARPDEALPWLEKACGAVPKLPFIHALLASACGLTDAIERAAVELAEAQRLTGDGHFSSIAALKGFGNARGYLRAPNIDYEATYFTGLRKAGMPEE